MAKIQNPARIIYRYRVPVDFTVRMDSAFIAQQDYDDIVPRVAFGSN
jgi:hypothetical protein